MPDGTTRFSMLDGTPIYHYMGCSTFANHTVMPEIALAKVREDAPFDKICYIGCGVTTGIGAVINTAGVEIGSTAAVFGLGGIGLNVIQGLRMAGCDMIIGVDLNDDKAVMAKKFGMTHFINPMKAQRPVVQEIVELTKTERDQIGGVDYSFDATGNVQVMRDALECSHRGWGVSVGDRGGALGGRDLDPPVPAGHRPGLEGHRLRRRQGAHRRAEIRRLVHGRQDRDRPDDHPQAEPRRDQQGL